MSLILSIYKEKVVSQKRYTIVSRAGDILPQLTKNSGLRIWASNEVVSSKGDYCTVPPLQYNGSKGIMHSQAYCLIKPMKAIFKQNS